MQDTNVIRVYLLDDHAVLREGFARLFDSEAGISVVGQGGTAAAALEAAVALAPDVMVIDLQIPDRSGAELVAELSRVAPNVKRLVLTSSEDGPSILEAFGAGAQGYLVKTDEPADVMNGIRAIAKGEKPLSKRIPQAIVDQLHKPLPEGGSLLNRLTPRQRDTMRLLAEGHDVNNIAKLWCLSPKTIETHRDQVYKRLGIDHNLADLARMAIRLGLVKP